MTVTKPTGMRSPVDHGDRHQPPLVGRVGFPLGALEGERIFDRPRRDLHRRPVGKNSFTRKPSVARADQSLVMSGHFSRRAIASAAASGGTNAKSWVLALAKCGSHRKAVVAACKLAAIMSRTLSCLRPAACRQRRTALNCP